MGRSSTRHAREIYGWDSAGECAFQHGEVANDDWPYCQDGVRVTDAVVLDALTIQITFSQCASVQSVTGIDFQKNLGGWLAITGSVKVSDTVWNFTLTGGQEILAGDNVDWRYQGGTDSIVDCEVPPVDVGPLGPIDVRNPLVLTGGFVLLESGGANIVLVEDDDDGSAGIIVEDKT